MDSLNGFMELSPLPTNEISRWDMLDLQEKVDVLQNYFNTSRISS